jgi:hypothetical protein
MKRSMRNFAALLTEYRKSVLAERGTLWYHPDYELSAEFSEADSIHLSEDQPLKEIESSWETESPLDAIPLSGTQDASEDLTAVQVTTPSMELISSPQASPAELTLESAESIPPLSNPIPTETQIALQNDLQASDIPEASRVLSPAALAVQRLKRSKS